MEESVPVVAANVAEMAFAATVTEAGTVSAAALSDSDTTTPPEDAAFDSVTVQEVVAFAARLVAAHFTDVSSGAAVRLTDVFTDEPFHEAVTVAV